MKPLILKYGNHEITHTTESKIDGVHQHTFVLNSAYKYPVHNTIKNTTDKVDIKHHLIQSIDYKIKTLPPTPKVFTELYNIYGNKVFSIFNVVPENIPIEYLKNITLTHDTLPSLKNTLYTNKTKQKYSHIEKYDFSFVPKTVLLPTYKDIVQKEHTLQDMKSVVKDFYGDKNKFI